MDSESYWCRSVRRRALVKGAAFAGAGVGAAALVGCGDDDSSPAKPASPSGASTTASTTTGSASPAASAAAQPVKGGTLRMVGGPAADSDLSKVGRSFADPYYPSLVMFNRLVKRDLRQNYKLSPELAAKWDIDPDGLNYTFTLRDGVKWHDGKPLIADDIEFSVRRVTDAKVGFLGTANAYFAPLKEINVVDAKTIRFSLSKPSAPFLTAFSHNFLPVLPAHQPNGTVGSGPFKLKDIQNGVKWTFEKNADYWDTGKPYLDGIEMSYVLNDAAGNQRMLDSIRAGQLDLVVPQLATTGSLLKQVEDMKDSTLLKVTDGRWYFTFNNVAPWNDDRVRRALDMGFDRNTFCKLAFQDGTFTFGSMLYPTSKGIWGYSDEELKTQYPYYAKPDLDGARRLLAEAGVKTPIDVEVKVAATYRAESEVFGQILKGIGLNPKITVLENATWNEQVTKGQFEMIFGSALGIIDDPADFIGAFMYTKDASRNYGKFDLPEVNALYQQQDAATDPAKRKALVRQLDQAIQKTGVYPVIAFRDYMGVAKKTVQNLPPLRQYYDLGFALDDTWLQKA